MHPPRLSRLLAMFALLAMMVRAIVPVGYMLSSPEQAGGKLVMTLCSAQGAVQVSFDGKTGAISPLGEAPAQGDPRDQNRHAAAADGMCVFAASADLAPFPEARTQFIAIAHTKLAAPARPLAFPGRGLAAPPPWATGPPARA